MASFGKRGNALFSREDKSPAVPLFRDGSRIPRLMAHQSLAPQKTKSLYQNDTERGHPARKGADKMSALRILLHTLRPKTQNVEILKFVEQNHRAKVETEINRK
jgi:hypothetical protein